MSTTERLLEPSDAIQDKTGDNWEQIEDAAPELFYQRSDGAIMYVTDTHQGRLRKKGDRYHLVKREPYSDSTVLDTANEVRST